MKDSQPAGISMNWPSKYIKESNERFSTVSSRQILPP